MKSSSPCSSNPDSDSTGSDEMPLSSSTDRSQEFLLNPGHSNDKLPVTPSVSNLDASYPSCLT